MTAQGAAPPPCARVRRLPCSARSKGRLRNCQRGQARQSARLLNAEAWSLATTGDYRMIYVLAATAGAALGLTLWFLDLLPALGSTGAGVGCFILTSLVLHLASSRGATGSDWTSSVEDERAALTDEADEVSAGSDETGTSDEVSAPDSTCGEPTDTPTPTARDEVHADIAMATPAASADAAPEGTPADSAAPEPPALT